MNLSRPQKDPSAWRDLPLISDISSEGRYNKDASENGDTRDEKTDFIRARSLCKLWLYEARFSPGSSTSGSIPFRFHRRVGAPIRWRIPHHLRYFWTGYVS